MTGPGVQIEVTACDAVGCRVGIRGEIDMATIATLRTALTSIVDTATSGCRIQLDVEHVEFLSAAGVRVFVQAGERVRDVGGVLVVDPVSPIVERILRACGSGEMVGLVTG